MNDSQAGTYSDPKLWTVETLNQRIYSFEQTAAWHKEKGQMDRHTAEWVDGLMRGAAEMRAEITKRQQS